MTHHDARQHARERGVHDRGYAATREAAMAEFKAAWERK
jgi:hypothetical protein